MALAVADRVKETSTTAGTGTLTLLGAVSGYQSFSVIGSGNTTYYCIVDDNTGQWEVGVGTYTSPNQLSRDTVLSSSSGGSAITFLGNIKQVFVTYPAERSVYENAAGSLVLSKVEATTGIITNLTSTSAVLTNVSATSATVTNLTLTSLTISSLSITNLSAASATITTGNLTFSSTGQRITGDMSTATFSNRLAFQTSTANSATSISSLPNGTGTASNINCYNNSDPTNSSLLLAGTNATEALIQSGIRGTGSYLPMTFYTGGSERMRLDTSGQLGIGTTNPQGRLHVTGTTTNLASGYSALNVFSSDALAADKGGRISLGGVSGNGASFDPYGFVAIAGLKENATASNFAGYFTVSTSNSGGVVTERMRIDSSGNVGIGTASPGFLFDAYNSSTAVDYVAGRFYSAAAASGESRTWLKVEKGVNYGGAVGGYISQGVGSGLIFGTQNNSSTPTERMRIDNNGNVGIGTTTLNQKATIWTGGTLPSTIANCQLLVGDTTGFANAGLALTTNAVNGSAIFFGSTATPTLGRITYDNTSNYMELFTNSSARMRIDSSGNVGIGTTPNATLTPRLQVSSAFSAATAGTPYNGVFVESSDAQAADKGGVISLGGLYDASSGPTRFAAIAGLKENGTSGNYAGYLAFYSRANGSSPAERMRIDSSGNVGIGGTAQALTRVDVVGTLPTSSNQSEGIRVIATIPSGSTTGATMFGTWAVTQAASFTLSSLIHFKANQQTLGAGSAITNQYGFYADAALTGATNNYGFYSNIASGSNRWNFYAAGTAQNYFAGDTGVGATPVANTKLTVKGANQTSGQYTFIARDGSDNNTFVIENDGLIITGTQASSPYNNTTGSAANMVVSVNGLLQRSTSSLRYKTNVTDAVHGLADVLKLRSVIYKGINDGDTIFGGLIAEEVHDAGLTEFVAYDKEGRPDALHYGNMVALLVKAVQELKAELEALKAA